MNRDFTIVREDRNYDYWFGYSSDSLTKLCKAFVLPTSGSKKEKAARLCFAWEIGMEPRGTDEENKIVEEERQSKLKLPEFLIPDPKTIPDRSYKSGPPASLPFFDRKQIIDYYNRNPFIAPPDVNDLTKYVKTVAFTLFKCGHVKGMRCHECESVPCTIVFARCDSTMMNKVYEVWIAMHRETAEILTGFCSCIAGLPGYCKHLFAVLFSLEFYSDVGDSNPSCTSQPQQWGQPSATSKVPPTPTAALTLKKTVLDHQPKRTLQTAKKQQYVAWNLPMTDGAKVDLVRKLGTEFEKCGIFVVKSRMQVQPTVRTMKSIIHDWQPKITGTMAEKIAGCLSDIRDYFTPERVADIQTDTRDQAKNPVWFEHRIYRITASVASEVLAAVKRFEESVPADQLRKHGNFINYFASLSENEKVPHLEKLLPPSRLRKLEGAQFDAPALRYGRENESTALKEFLVQHQQSGCAEAVLEPPSGLLVLSERPYLGASLDGVIRCAKHGRFIVETKCPFRCSPSLPENRRQRLSAILNLDAAGGLVKNDYRWQQIMQMGVSGLRSNHLFFWSPDATFTEVVDFNVTEWEGALRRLDWYFEQVILRTVLKNA